jgi:CheY-like chemotaxis protein
MRVLVVDDNLDALNAAGALFSAEGHIVTLSSSPADALAHAATNRPEVIVLDIGMPGMDGFELARAIRALDHKPRPLIIALSGFTEADDITRGRAAGFDYHYPKTVHPRLLLTTLREHAGRIANQNFGKPH